MKTALLLFCFSGFFLNDFLGTILLNFDFFWSLGTGSNAPDRKGKVGIYVYIRREQTAFQLLQFFAFSL